MRDEYKKGAAWMANFHWIIQTTFDPNNPVVTSEQPLFVKGVKTQDERAMTMDLLTDDGSEVWFPLCWQAALVGRVRPFESDSMPFTQTTLNGSIAEFVGAESGGRRRSEEKSKSRTFPPRLEIPQVQRDSHFFHRPCCDEPYFDFPVQEEIADSRPDGLVCCLRRQ